MKTQKNAQDAFNKLKDMDFGGMKNMYEALSSKIEPTLRKITEENMKITKPKSKKNVFLNGEGCSVSLIEDGRVLVNFPSLDASAKFYEEIDKLDSKKMAELERMVEYHKKNALDFSIALDFERKKPWYKKLFNR